MTDTAASPARMEALVREQAALRRVATLVARDAEPARQQLEHLALARGQLVEQRRRRPRRRRAADELLDHRPRHRGRDQRVAARDDLDGGEQPEDQRERGVRAVGRGEVDGCADGLSGHLVPPLECG